MSAGDYPAEWEADVVLTDGGTVHVRPVRPVDADRLVAFHGRLSHQSIYYRFFSPRPRLSREDVTRFTTVDYDDRMALVALLGDDLIGIASYDRWPGRREAEVAFTVDDEHQGRGVATVLLEHLAVIARSHGITRFTAEVLPENRKMLSVFKRAGFAAKSQFADGVVEVEMGILETDAALEAMHEREHVAEARSVARLLAPRTIAVIGAGARRGTVGHETLRNLIAHGFTGAVYPVHPTAHSVASVRAWPTILDVPDDIDLAIIAVPAGEVIKVVEQCARKRVRGLIILSAGFAEADEEGARTEHELVSIAHRHGMRVLGPASMGVISTVPEVSMYATYAPVTLIPGRVAFSSQSGPLGVALLEQAHRAGVGISHFVALGNKADVSTNDFLQYWEGDASTSVLALHISSFGNPRKFTRIARRVSKTKPIVAVKTGGGEAETTVDALFRQTGIIPVGGIGELFDVARVLDTQPLPPGDRVAVLSNAHGAHALAQAALPGAGLRLAELSADTRAHLASILPKGASVANPVDLTFTAEPADYDAALRATLADPNVDAAVVIFASALPEKHRDVADVIVAAHAAHPSKPVLASVLGVEDRGLRDRAGHVVPAFAFPETAVTTLGRVAEHAAWKRRPEDTLPDASMLGIDLDRAGALIVHALEVRPTGTLLPWSIAAEVLKVFGIGVAPGVAVAALDDALAARAAPRLPGGAEGDGHATPWSFRGRRSRARPPRRRRAARCVSAHERFARPRHERGARPKDDRARARDRGRHHPRPDVRTGRHVRPRRGVRGGDRGRGEAGHAAHRQRRLGPPAFGAGVGCARRQ